MSFPSTCFSWIGSESDPLGMVTMICLSSRSQLNRDVCLHSQSVGVFSVHQTSDLPKSTLDSGGPASLLVRKGNRGLNCGSMMISFHVFFCQQDVNSSLLSNAFLRTLCLEDQKRHSSEFKTIKHQLGQDGSCLATK